MSRLLLICALGAGCSSSPSAGFTLVDQNETGSLLSVWGTSATDVWAVGGRPDLAADPTVLHFDGSAWTRMDPGQPGVDLWWAFGVDGDVFFSGSSGTILRYRNGTFEKLATPSTDGVVFGMWGPTSTDIWAVGRVGSGAGVLLWHFDGTTWTAVDPPADFPAGLLGFKVHGQRTDDVWISCSGGRTLHWNGSALETVPTDTTSSLFSIVTTATDVVTAGDVASSGYGTLEENSGNGWKTAALSVTAPWRGLSASATGDVYVVGADGLIARRDSGKTWATVEQTLTQQSFHADWIDPDGGFWGVGGQFETTPLTSNGFLLYLGTETVSKITPAP